MPAGDLFFAGFINRQRMLLNCLAKIASFLFLNFLGKLAKTTTNEERPVLSLPEGTNFYCSFEHFVLF